MRRRDHGRSVGSGRWTVVLGIWATATLVALGGCAGEAAFGPGATTAADMTAADPAGDPDAIAERLITRVTSLEVVHKKPVEMAATVRTLAEELDGFVLSSVEHRKDHSQLTLRVPREHFDTARSSLRGIGKVVREEIHGDDVTERIRDLDLRLKGARHSREAYVALLEKATDVTEMLAVEKELERLTVEVERLQSELNVAEEGVDLATFAVTLRRPIRPGPVGWVFYGTFRAVKWLFVWD